MASARFCFGSPFSKKVVVCGQVISKGYRVMEMVVVAAELLFLVTSATFSCTSQLLFFTFSCDISDLCVDQRSWKLACLKHSPQAFIFLSEAASALAMGEWILNTISTSASVLLQLSFYRSTSRPDRSVTAGAE